VGALAENIDALAAEFSVQAAPRTASADGTPDRVPDLGIGGAERLAWIHVTKFSQAALDRLTEHGLVVRGRPREAARLQVSPHWGEPQHWVGMHPVLAGAYMTALAGQVSELSHFQPLTDQVQLNGAAASPDVRSAVALLTGSVGDATGEGKPTYVALALEAVLPDRLEAVPPETILRCREDLAEELVQFRQSVASLAGEMREVASILPDEHRVERFSRLVYETVEMPLQRLEKAMKLWHLPTTKRLLVAGTLAPPASVVAVQAGLANAPVVANSMGAAAIVGTAWWSMQHERASLVSASPVGYLFAVRRRLTPRSFVGRTADFLAGRR